MIRYMAEQGILKDAGKSVCVYKVPGPAAAPAAKLHSVVDPVSGQIAEVELVYQAGDGGSTATRDAAARQHLKCSATVCQLDIAPVACAECGLPSVVHHMCLCVSSLCTRHPVVRWGHAECPLCSCDREQRLC